MSICLIIAAAFIVYVNRQLLPMLKPVISADLGWGDTQYGTVVAAYQAAGAVALLLGGVAVDRMGLRWAGTVLMGAWAIATIGHMWANTLVAFVLLRMIAGASQATSVPMALKAVKILLPAQMRATAVGILNAASIAGMIAAPFLIPLLAAALGWRGAFLLSGLVGCLWAVAWWWCLPTGVRVEEAPPAPAVSLRGILSRRVVWGLIGAKFLSDLTWWLSFYWLPDYFFRQFDLETTELGGPLVTVYSLSAIGSVTAGLLTSVLIGRGASAPAVRFGALLFAAVAVPLFLPFATRAEDAATSALVIGLALAAHQVFAVSLFSLIADVTGAEEIGRVTGLVVFAGNVGGILISKVADVVLTAGHGYLPLFIGCAFTYALAVIWLWMMIPAFRRR